MSIPTMTPLQYLILAALRHTDRRGESLRATLDREGHATSLSSFYQTMKRLESLEWVQGRYEATPIHYAPGRRGPLAARERSYAITPPGRTAWAETRRFYCRFAADS
jgi:DNA-binding PadR family transcriptional regulator